MDESNKLPLKRVELSLTKFNEVAIPHHLDLLRQHRVNIIKHESQGSYGRVQSEQVNARRVAQQLRGLLIELDTLRRRVRGEDLPRFDQLTQRSRDLTLKAIVDYLEASSAAPPAPPAQLAGSLTSAASVGLVPDEEPDEERHEELDERLQLHVDDHELALREREAVLRGWSELQTELRALRGAWEHVQAAALQQRERVAAAAGDVQAAAHHAEAARGHLAAAGRLRAGAWLAGGAAGALAAGPLGLLLGLKAGAAAALAGSLLGALGARALARRAPPLHPPALEPPPADHKDKLS